MSIYRIKLNDKVYEMEVELIEEGKPKSVKPVEGKPVSVDTHKEAKPSSKNEEKRDNTTNTIDNVSPNTITSPMPGSIIELAAGEGDKVKEGDVVLILEAMKMENEICAPKSGTIKAIYVKEGQAVSSGAPLFEMEE